MECAAGTPCNNQPARRHVIAVIGDGNLDPSSLGHLAQGDEHKKQILAQQVRVGATGQVLTTT
jgi:hypothetical protein